MGYDESTKILEIEFQTGLVYQYAGVPLKVYQGTYTFRRDWEILYRQGPEPVPHKTDRRIKAISGNPPGKYILLHHLAQK